MKKLLVWVFLSSFVLTSNAQENKILILHLERIDPATGKIETEVERVPADNVGIIITDMWDKHWCKSWTAREAAMVPKMNRILASARKMGVQVIFSPSSVADFYKDYPQRKAVLNMPRSGDYEYPSVYQLQDSAGQKTGIIAVTFSDICPGLFTKPEKLRVKHIKDFRHYPLLPIPGDANAGTGNVGMAACGPVRIKIC